MPRRTPAFLTVLLLLTLAACQKPSPTNLTTRGGEVRAEEVKTYRWSFDDPQGRWLPADFINVLGDWKVEAEGTAPSTPNVLRKRGAFRDSDFPRDGTFAEAGKVGVWTKADLVTLFDDLSVAGL